MRCRTGCCCAFACALLYTFCRHYCCVASLSPYSTAPVGASCLPVFLPPPCHFAALLACLLRRRDAILLFGVFVYGGIITTPWRLNLDAGRHLQLPALFWFSCVPFYIAFILGVGNMVAFCTHNTHFLCILIYVSPFALLHFVPFAVCVVWHSVVPLYTLRVWLFGSISVFACVCLFCWRGISGGHLTFCILLRMAGNCSLPTFPSPKHPDVYFRRYLYIPMDDIPNICHWIFTHNSTWTPISLFMRLSQVVLFFVMRRFVLFCSFSHRHYLLYIPFIPTKHATMGCCGWRHDDIILL